jgi:hypothetical protein
MGQTTDETRLKFLFLFLFPSLTESGFNLFWKKKKKKFPPNSCIQCSIYFVFLFYMVYGNSGPGGKKKCGGGA